MKQYTYIIGWNQLNANSGGQIVLYSLCHFLNDIGEEAYMNGESFPNALNLNCPRKPKELNLESEDVVVVYPEVTEGNPLGVKNVVRWMLYPIGINGGNIKTHSKNDLIIGWGKECSGGGYTINEDNSIIIKYILSDIYKNLNLPSRIKTCYMRRKGSKWGQSYNQHPQDSICIDGKSHQEISEIFNYCHTFYCYDPHTYYSTYASMCGCDSVVIPPSGLKKTDWKNSIEDTYGIAYGIDDLERARKTRPLMFDYIKNQNNSNIENAHKFVKLCEDHF